MKQLPELSYIYSADGDIAKRWYVYFWMINPDTGEKAKFREYRQVNRIKDPAHRLQKLLAIKKEIDEKILKGWNPHDEIYALSPGKVVPIGLAINRVLKFKKRSLKFNAYRSVLSHLLGFQNWLGRRGMEQWPVTMIKRNHVNEFLKFILDGSITNRTRNNYLIDIRAFFNELIRDNIINFNPCQGINFLPDRSERHVTYTEDELKKIIDYLHKYDAYLLLFVRFITYAFMRPDQIKNLQVKHIDLTTWQIYIPAANEKTNRSKVKPIQKAFRPFIETLNLKKYDPDDYLFTVFQRPGKDKVGTNYFTRRFNILKQYFKFSTRHTMYGLRHTYVCQLLRNGAPSLDVMKLTGHASMDAFEKYLRDIKADPVKDLSDKYSILI